MTTYVIEISSDLAAMADSPDLDEDERASLARSLVALLPGGDWQIVLPDAEHDWWISQYGSCVATESLFSECLAEAARSVGITITFI